MALEHLTLIGQIHILNSPFYLKENNAITKQPGTGNYIIHHMHELDNFQYKVLYNPDNWVRGLITRGSPYCHILIKNRYQ